MTDVTRRKNSNYMESHLLGSSYFIPQVLSVSLSYTCMLISMFHALDMWLKSQKMFELEVRGYLRYSSDQKRSVFVSSNLDFDG